MTTQPESWPPPGHSFSYRAEIQLDGGPTTVFDTTLPSGIGEVDIATLRFGRHGGPTPADHTFRRKLYEAVGNVTVAGAHVEAALKRALLNLSGTGSRFDLADFQWADLEKKLRGMCDGSTPERVRLEHVLGWAAKRRLREKRHDVVHGAWIVWDGVGLQICRWPRKSSDVIIVYTWDSLEAVGTDCWTYATKLDSILGEAWPRAMMPASSGGPFQSKPPS
jgi:hypothetical protein